MIRGTFRLWKSIATSTVLTVIAIQIAAQPVVHARELPSYEIRPLVHLFDHHYESQPTATIVVDKNGFGIRTLRSFFRTELSRDHGNDLSVEGRVELRNALRAVHEAHLAELTNEERKVFDTFNWARLDRWVESLTVSTLTKQVFMKGMLYGDQTIDALMVQEEEHFVRASKSPVAKAVNLLKLRRPNAKVLVNGVLASAFIAAAYYWGGTGEFLITVYLLVLQEPARTVSAALTGWINRPLTRFSQLIDYRWFGGYDRYFQIGIDRLLQKLPSSNESVNQVVKIGTLATNEMNFGGMTADDQRANMMENREGWVTMQTRHDQLFTETMRWGRTVQGDFWGNEATAANEIRLADMYRKQIRQAQQARLMSYESALLNRTDLTQDERNTEKDKLVSALNSIHDAHDSLWRDPYLPPAEVDRLVAQIRLAEITLRDVGASSLTLREINKEEYDRREATRLKVMHLTINVANVFGQPDSNRNMAPGAGLEAILETRRGYGLSKEEQEWLTVIGTVLRRMGYKRNQTLDNHIATQRRRTCADAYAL